MGRNDAPLAKRPATPMANSPTTPPCQDDPGATMYNGPALLTFASGLR